MMREISDTKKREKILPVILRILSLLILLIPVILLEGCSVSDSLSKKMMEKSGISSNADYMRYEMYVSENKIDANGYEKIGYEDRPLNSARITFATNSNIDTSFYYSDAVSTGNKIEDECFYLSEGQSIYVKAESSIDNDMYEIKSINIYKYDNGTRTYYSQSQLIDGETVLSYSEDLAEQDLSIEVIGTYKEREFTVTDFYEDDDDIKHNIDGEWTVNDKIYTGDKVSISSTSSYIVSYQYPSDEYFYLDSEPDYFYLSMDDGLIVFDQKTPSDITTDYLVELHPYLNINLSTAADRNVSINNGEYVSYKANTEVPITKLKYEEEVVLKTNVEWDSLKYNEELILIDEDKKGSTYEYTLYVASPDATFMFDPTEYVYEHGEITFTCFGTEITSTRLLPCGAKIYCTQKSADEGYWLGEEAIVVEVTDEIETKKKLNEIHFNDKIPVIVNLPQPSAGGSIKYSIDGKTLYYDFVETYSGTEIRMEYDSWPGWYLATGISDIYTTTGVNGQDAIGGNVTIDNVFIEDANHKPKLSIKLKKSVGSNMKIAFSIGDSLTDQDYYVDNEWIGTDCNLISNQVIGTAKGIDVSLSDCSIPSGQAVKIEVIKVSTDNVKTTNLYYIDKLPNSLNLPIYEKDELGKSDIWYKSIDVNVSVVDVDHYNASLLKIDNTTLTVKNKITDKYILNGEIIEPGTPVVVNLSPHHGYYIEKVGGFSNDIVNGNYQNEMKYKDYEKNASTIKGNYKAQKYIGVTLDASDSYAKYTYNQVVGFGKSLISAGENQFKVGDVIELTYEITDGSHSITKPSGAFQDDKKASRKITITSDMEGTTLKKEDFGIETN